MAIEDYQALDREALLDALRSLDTDLADLRTSYELVMEHNSLLENELYSRNASLQLGLIEQSNELQATRALNQKAHQHLLMTEKLAKLGELVAGMTHELNTPIGVAFTAASFQQTCTDHLGGVLAENKGKPLDNELMATLSADLEGLSETSAMLQTNLRRATEIVGSFKQMASDQVSDRARDFSLAEIIQQTLLSLRPRMRNTPFKVELDCSQQIRIFSYPGTISQIVANLVVNSLIHGFEGRDQGLIRISARLGEGADTGTVIITHQDNGHGIPADVLPRIFDQFFTTKEGAGGTGLGLHIVKSLVSERLGGTISCSTLAASGDGTGTTAFEIRLPVDFNSPKS